MEKIEKARCEKTNNIHERFLHGHIYFLEKHYAEWHVVNRKLFAQCWSNSSQNTGCERSIHRAHQC